MCSSDLTISTLRRAMDMLERENGRLRRRVDWYAEENRRQLVDHTEALGEKDQTIAFLRRGNTDLVRRINTMKKET